MELMKDRIKSEGKVLPGNVLKVGSFLNQQIDSNLLSEMGKEFARLYKDSGVNKILTIETSGIAIAASVAMAMNVPMVFAKKHQSSNVDGDVYQAECYSYTHNSNYTMVVSKDYLNANDHILIIDDFLALGNALNSLISIVNESGASLVGCGIAIEKGFQGGGDLLREQGIRVESLAIVDSMSDTDLNFRD